MLIIVSDCPRLGFFTNKTHNVPEVTVCDSLYVYDGYKDAIKLTAESQEYQMTIISDQILQVGQSNIFTRDETKIFSCREVLQKYFVCET